MGPGAKCIVMPTGHKCTIVAVNINDEEMKYAQAGENVTLAVKGVTEDQLSKGYVLCDAPKPIPVVTKFKAQLKITELPEERPVLTSGYKCILHVHVASEECEIIKLYDVMYLADKKKEEKPKYVRENSVVTCTIKLERS